MSDAMRFVAVDLDGTVLVEHAGISERTFAAFAALKARGIVPLVATGRARRAALPWVERLGVDAGFVGHNGAVVYDGEGRLLAETTIPEPTARRLVEAARGIPVHFHGYAHDVWYYETEYPGTSRYEVRAGFPGTRIDFGSLERLGFHKAMFIGSDAEAGPLEARLGAEFGGALGVYPSGSGFIEIIAPGVGKGKSLARLVGALGGRMGEVLAFGDAWNDEEMLRAAGIGVAMGNAPAELRARIGRVAAPAAEDGVARWLEEFFGLPS